MASTNYRILSTPASRGETNKQNAQHSTGPQTAEGKAVSSQNARTHGLTSKQVVLPGEDPAEYDRRRADLHRELKPATFMETTLVDEIAQCWWRRQRVYATETAFIGNRIKELTDKDRKLSAADAQARMFTDPAEISRMRLVMRYVASAERAYNRAVSMLMNLQAERKAEEKRLAAEAQKQQPKNNDGFVSQSPKLSSNTPSPSPSEATQVASDYLEMFMPEARESSEAA